MLASAADRSGCYCWPGHLGCGKSRCNSRCSSPTLSLWAFGRGGAAPAEARGWGGRGVTSLLIGGQRVRGLIFRRPSLAGPGRLDRAMRGLPLLYPIERRLLRLVDKQIELSESVEPLERVLYRASP